MLGATSPGRWTRPGLRAFWKQGKWLKWLTDMPLLRCGLAGCRFLRAIHEAGEFAK